MYIHIADDYNIPDGRGEFHWSRGEYGIKVLRGPDEHVMYNSTELYRLAILYIPKGELIFHAGPRNENDQHKCRASKAVVVSIVSVFRDPNNFVKLVDVGCGYSMWFTTMHGKCDRVKYEVGSIVTPNEEFSLTREACASGIHYYQSVYDLLHSYLRSVLFEGFYRYNWDATITKEKLSREDELHDRICDWCKYVIEKHRASMEE